MSSFKTFLDSVASRTIDQDLFVPRDPAEIVDFCLNKCPHPKKSCKGTCPEFKEFEKKIKGDK